MVAPYHATRLENQDIQLPWNQVLFFSHSVGLEANLHITVSKAFEVSSPRLDVKIGIAIDLWVKRN